MIPIFVTGALWFADMFLEEPFNFSKVVTPIAMIITALEFRTNLPMDAVMEFTMIAHGKAIIIGCFEGFVFRKLYNYWRRS